MQTILTLIEKAAPDSGIDGTWAISTKNPDRVGDTIDPKALAKNVGKTLPALFGHDHESIVGSWVNLRMAGEKLLADLKLAAVEKGIMLKTLLQAGVPISASIGFRGKGEKNTHGGLHFKELDIFETSLVAVPCNAEAVRVKALELGMDVEPLFDDAVSERLLTVKQRVALKRAAAAIATATEMTKTTE